MPSTRTRDDAAVHGDPAAGRGRDAEIQEWGLSSLNQTFRRARLAEPHTFEVPSEREDMAAVRGPRWLEATIQIVLPPYPPAQTRFPRIESGQRIRPSGSAAGAVHVYRQMRRERARSHPPQRVRLVTGRPTDLSPDRADVRQSPNDASRVGLLRCRGTRE